MIFNMIGNGGSSAGLNFKVVGGTVQPNNPSENTIWVNTENEITGWYFSIDDPFTIGEIVEEQGAELGSYTMIGLDETLYYTLTKANSGKAAKIIGAVSSDLDGYYDKYLILLSSDEDACKISRVGTASTEILEAESSFLYDGVTYYYSYVDLNNTVEDADSSYVSIEEAAMSLLPIYNSEGKVWIKTGKQSDISFNALKKNSIKIQPLSANQYINGSWMENTAQIYQSGEWRDWIDWSKWIVKGGLYKMPMVAAGVPYDSSYSKTTFTVTQKDGYILFEQTSGTGMVLWGPVELTGVDTITIEGDFSGGVNGSYANHFMLGVWGKFPPTQINTWDARKLLTATGATLDVSAIQGERYVGFSVRNMNSERVANLYIE